MKYVDDMGNKIPSMYELVSYTIEEVYNGEDSYRDNYDVFNGGIESFDAIVLDDVKNRNDENGTEYKLTEKQKEKLRKRYLELKSAINAIQVQDKPVMTSNNQSILNSLYA